MQALRTNLALIVSGVVHAGVVMGVGSRATPTYLPVNTFAPMEVVEPPAAPEPTPPPESKPAEPAAIERAETRVRALEPIRSQPRPVAAKPESALREERPVALAGFSLSNQGVVLASSNGSGFTPRSNGVTNVPAPSPAPSKKTTAMAPALTPLADLSRKPSAPALDAALARNYPPHLRASGVEGQALVRVIVDTRGEVRSTTLLSESAAGFGNACQQALKGSRWGPPIDRMGNPTSTSLQYRCRFTVGS